MRIKLNLQIFLFLVIFYFTKQLEHYVLIMFFAFLHEMGHLITGLLLGMKPKTLQIMPLGLSISFEKYTKRKYILWHKIVVASAGPLVNLVFAMIALCIPNRFWGINREMMFYSNCIILLFNLLPIYPLDGGRIVKYALQMKRPLKIAMKRTYQIANITVIVLTIITSIAILYVKNIAILFVLTYLWILVIKENKQYYLKSRIYEVIEKENSYLKYRTIHSKLRVEK